MQGALARTRALPSWCCVKEVAEMRKEIIGRQPGGDTRRS
jgi:hypothetical protein